MGIIVTLPPPRRRRAAADTATSEATILLFMGVRYVRDEDEAGAEAAAPSIVPDGIDDCPPLEIA